MTEFENWFQRRTFISFASWVLLGFLVHGGAGAVVLSRDHVKPVSATEVQFVEKIAPKDVKDKALGDVKKTAQKLKEFSRFHEDVHQGFRDVWNIFLYELSFKPFFFRISAAIFVFGTLWLWFYFTYCLKLDRTDRPHDNQLLKNLRDADRSIGDVVYVFDHPSGPQAEGDKSTSMDPRPMATEVFNGHPEEFPRIKNLMDRLNEPPPTDEEQAAGDKGMKNKASAFMTKGLGDMKDLAGTLTGMGGKHEVTVWDVKVALLQDMCEILGGMGFTLRAYTSIDKDEVYLCCSLQDPEVIEDILETSDTRLQILPSVVEGLKIKYPADVDEEKQYLYDPPFLRFDPKGMVHRLKDSKVIKERDPKEVYRHDNPGEEFIGGRDRVRIIAQRLSKCLDADDAANRGLLKAWFAMHNEPSTEQLNEHWASFYFLTDLSFIQPIATIYEYFGSRIAFMFAWNGLYCKALLGLAPIAILVGGSTGILWGLDFYREVVAANPMGLGFSLVLMVWCRMTSNQWLQNQHYHIEDWDISEEGGIARPNYRGEMRPSEVDLNKMEKYYPPQYRAMWKFFSAIVILAFCCLVAVAAFFWDFAFDGKVNLTGSILLAIQIKVFELVYHQVAVNLTECENHKFNTEYYNSFVWKKVMFYAVNSYYPFFYLAVVQGAYQQGGRGRGECIIDGRDCIIVLRHKLFSTMLVLVVMRVVSVVIASFVVRLKVWLEAYQLKKSGQYEPGKEPVISFEERQTKAAPYGPNEQAETMLQLVLPLGYVLLFGSTTPTVAVLCLLLFMVNIRATGTLLLNSAQRPFPSRCLGIGAWQDVLGLLQQVAMIANGFFLVQYGATFKGTPILTKCTGLLIFAITTTILWKIVDLFVPQKNEDVDLLIRRRKEVIDRIGHLSYKKAKKHDQQHGGLAATVPTGCLAGIRKSRIEKPIVTKAEDAKARSSSAPPAPAKEKALVLSEDSFDDIELFPGAEPGTESMVLGEVMAAP